jgi:hypothetical protein
MTAYEIVAELMIFATASFSYKNKANEAVQISGA